MGSFRDDLLPIIDSIRSIPEDFGIRLWTCTIRINAWDGGRLGVGNRLSTDVPLVLGNGRRPKIRELTTAEVIASGGVITAGTYEIGPLTPGIGGGALLTYFDPSYTDVSAKELLFLIAGEGLPTGGIVCKRVNADILKPFSPKLRVERINLDYTSVIENQT